MSVLEKMQYKRICRNCKAKVFLKSTHQWSVFGIKGLCHTCKAAKKETEYRKKCRTSKLSVTKFVPCVICRLLIPSIVRGHERKYCSSCTVQMDHTRVIIFGDNRKEMRNRKKSLKI